MPELPDVELFKRRLDDSSLSQFILKILVSDARILGDLAPRAFAGKLEGHRFESSRRHGKHLLVALERGGWLTLHFGMTGSLEYLERLEDEPPYTRVRFDFAGGRHLAYSNRRMLGRVGWTEDAEAFIRAENLGPDALDPGLDLAAFRAALGGGRKTVKAALMDQSAMAGIGNIFADEILFQAKLHPATPTGQLSDRDTKELFKQTRKVLETAIDCGAGSEQFQDRLPKRSLLPQRKKGGHCPRCGAALEIFKASGRTGYFCAACQPAPGS